jgi:hypothetical protein
MEKREIEISPRWFLLKPKIVNERITPLPWRERVWVRGNEPCPLPP